MRSMSSELVTDLRLWKEFQAAARSRRRDPSKLLSEYMRECLELWEDQKLDAEIARQAQASGFVEADAVKIVRRHRLEKKRTRAAS
jgi:hypothetical protein